MNQNNLNEFSTEDASHWSYKGKIVISHLDMEVDVVHTWEWSQCQREKEHKKRPPWVLCWDWVWEIQDKRMGICLGWEAMGKLLKPSRCSQARPWHPPTCSGSPPSGTAGLCCCFIGTFPFTSNSTVNVTPYTVNQCLCLLLRKQGRRF